MGQPGAQLNRVPKAKKDNCGQEIVRKLDDGQLRIRNIHLYMYGRKPLVIISCAC